jgi:DNA polymerase III subunit beta
LKLTLSRADLIKAIGAAQRVVERRNTIPILGNIMLTAERGALHIKATDLDIEINTRASAEVDTPGSITVPAHLIHDITRKLPEGADVLLEFGGSSSPKGGSPTNSGTLRSGRSRFQIQTLPSSDFPDISTGTPQHSFDMPAPDLARIIADTEFAISTEETRYYLNGIYLHVAEVEGAPRLRGVATNGHQLARIDVTAPEGCASMAGVIVPRKAVGEIARLVDKRAEPVRLSLDHSKLRLDLGDPDNPDTTLITKLIDGTFPDYGHVIPAGNANRATLEIRALLAAIDRVSTVSSDRGRAVKLAFADGKLRLSVSNPDAGSADDEIEAEHDGPPIEIGFNARYVSEILSTLINRGADRVLLKMDHPGSPSIFVSNEAPDLLAVLMPMRV